MGQTFSPPAGGELCEAFDRPTVCMAFPERSEAFCRLSIPCAAAHGMLFRKKAGKTAK
jgi:hypothetical protein